MQFGIDTFGDITVDAGGKLLSHDQVLRNTVEEAIIADQAGVDVIALGEHHRPDFAISAPEILLSYIGAKTTRLILGTGVSILSTDDPIRLYQRFSTLNALTAGRGEIILGRGSFIESFPLFGYDLDQYEILFNEKLDLYTRVNKGGKVNWKGTHRTPVQVGGVYPPAGPQGIATWIGSGGNPESVIRAAHYNMPLMLAIIGGDPRRFRQLTGLYRQACEQLDQTPQALGVHSPGFIAKTDEEAYEIAFLSAKALNHNVGRERGWPALTKDAFMQEVERGSQYVGSPEKVARKIAATIKALGIQRFSLKYPGMDITHEHLKSTIELYGTKVIPMVRDMLAG